MIKQIIRSFLQGMLQENIANPYVKFGLLAMSGLIAFILSLFLVRAFRLAMRRMMKVPSSVVKEKLKAPFKTLFVVVVMNLMVPVIYFPRMYGYYTKKVLYIALLIMVAAFLIRIMQFFKASIFFKHAVNVKDNLSQRKVQTQITFIEKIINGFIIIVTGSLILMNFKHVKELGTSILASAGIAGVVIGLAAQKSISNLLAGLQIAFTQPIKIDDLVKVENETGRIEEITLSYVVVQIWDQRRMLLPISYFIDKPFENWTRQSAELGGTVYIYADYPTDIEAVRKELSRLLQGSSLWDGKMNALHVTDATDKSLQLRAVVSARNSGELWELRCMVREKLIDFIRVNSPESFPRIRQEQYVMKPSGPERKAEIEQPRKENEQRRAEGNE